MTIFQLAWTSLVVTWAMRRSARPYLGQRQRVVLLVGEVLEQRPRLLAGEVDEDEPLPDVDVDRPQGGRRAVDLVLLDHRRGHERPVEGVAPRVVGAAQVGAHLALLVVADPGAAVPADVVEGADLLVLAADDQDALAGDLDAQPGAGLGDPFGSPDVDPVAVEDPLRVDRVGLLGVVGHPGQRLPDLTGHSLTVQSVSCCCHGSRPRSRPADGRSHPSEGTHSGTADRACRDHRNRRWDSLAILVGYVVNPTAECLALTGAVNLGCLRSVSGRGDSPGEGQGGLAVGSPPVGWLRSRRWSGPAAKAPAGPPLTELVEIAAADAGTRPATAPAMAMSRFVTTPESPVDKGNPGRRVSVARWQCWSHDDLDH